MPTEISDYISGLDQSRPQGSESLGEADDHLRLTKKCITQTFLGDGDSDLWDTALNIGPRYLNDLLNTYTPDNWVTLDTEQTIDGAKTFTALVQADMGIANADGNNLISEAADVTAISNYADTTVVLCADQDGLSQAWDTGNVTATVLNTANVMGHMLDMLYPVGAVYHSTTPTDPGTHLGGTWARVGEGRFIASVGNHTDANGDVVNFAAGDIVEGTYNHTLTEAQMPSHRHDLTVNNSSSGGTHQITRSGGGTTWNDPTEFTGGDAEHNNTPPGYALYVWERTA
jgi:hypothetical protein